MERNLTSRMKILDVMEACMPAPRSEMNSNAPRIEVIQINPEKIGALIGPGGKNIRAITEETGADINIAENGDVKILANSKEVLDAARDRIMGCTAEAEIGKIYRGKVITVKDFGAFVEILPGQEGLLHISELADYRVKAVSDICNEGDLVSVKVLDIDNSGKMRLSRKAALEDMDD
jgi:polyribonucleotide nucleotidyltransferase